MIITTLLMTAVPDLETVRKNMEPKAKFPTSNWRALTRREAAEIDREQYSVHVRSAINGETYYCYGVDVDVPEETASLPRASSCIKI